MITEVSIRCQKNPGGWYTRIPAYTPQYTTDCAGSPRQQLHGRRYLCSLISYLMAFRADFWFDCLETVTKQLVDFSRHRGGAGPSATAHTSYM